MSFMCQKGWHPGSKANQRKVISQRLIMKILAPRAEPLICRCGSRNRRRRTIRKERQSAPRRSRPNKVSTMPRPLFLMGSGSGSSEVLLLPAYFRDRALISDPKEKQRVRT